MNNKNLEVSEILSMQNEIQNSFDDGFILEKAYGMMNKKYLPLTLEIWENLSPAASGTWALNSEELWICKLANSQDYNIKRVQPEVVMENAWKMTTKTKGRSVSLKVHINPETNKFTHPEEHGEIKEVNWFISEMGTSGKFGIFDEEGSLLFWPQIADFFTETKIKLIKDLNADELAKYAHSVFLLMGRNVMMGRLIYRCIELEKDNLLGLRSMSDFLDRRGTEAISASILEYIIKNRIPKTQESLKEHELILLHSKWAWGFCKHKSGKTNPPVNDFNDISNFIEDVSSYQRFLMTGNSSLNENKKIIEQANNLIGGISGILVSESLNQNSTPTEYLNTSDFRATLDYNKFLEEDTNILEDVKKRCDKMKK